MCTWHVWWRYILSSGIECAWHTPPKQYKTEKAAVMAASDLNAYYDFGKTGRIEHLALPKEASPIRFKKSLERHGN